MAGLTGWLGRAAVARMKSVIVDRQAFKIFTSAWLGCYLAGADTFILAPKFGGFATILAPSLPDGPAMLHRPIPEV